MHRFSVLMILSSTLLGTVLTAQVRPSRDVPLKNWAAPVYWQPSQAESEADQVHAEIRDPSQKATTPAGALVFVAMTPCRVVDTRSNCTVNPSLCSNAQFGPPGLATSTTRSFPIQLSPTCSIPVTAMAYSFNVTMIPNPTGSFAGYLTVWNTAAAPNMPPTAATILDFPTADVRSNAAIVPAGISNGSVSVVTNATNPLDVTIDINGYYAPSTGITLAQGGPAGPSLSFSGDSQTGIFSSGMGALDFATAGLDRLTIRSDGDLDLAGNIRKGGNPFLHNLGSVNLGVGASALAISTGTANTAAGALALSINTTGSSNTASGSVALGTNTTGSYNTAVGAGALAKNSTANANTATGYGALANNTSAGNTAHGYNSLLMNTTGSNNTAIGYQSLLNNTDGYHNTAIGDSSLANNTHGTYNTAVGIDALSNNTTGNHNIALGEGAGSNITTGSANIDIGSLGFSTDNGAIRIGLVNSQVSFFAAGINGVMTGGPATAVLVDSNGQLGTLSSSRRYKEDIQDMADASSGLMRLRPVTFRYQHPYADGSKPTDYGLIAEEVAEVYPDLVVKSADGQIETVQYHKLIPMLLNELQKLKDQVSSIPLLQSKISALQQALEMQEH